MDLKGNAKRMKSLLDIEVRISKLRGFMSEQDSVTMLSLVKKYMMICTRDIDPRNFDLMIASEKKVSSRTPS